MSKEQSLLLVDGSSYLYRAFHAAPPLNTRSGQPTGAIHVMLNMLHKTLREENTDLVAIVMDAPGKNFRHDMYPDYKACLLYTSPSPRDGLLSRMPSSA